jgi:hypothetical protein
MFCVVLRLSIYAYFFSQTFWPLLMRCVLQVGLCGQRQGLLPVLTTKDVTTLRRRWLHQKPVRLKLLIILQHVLQASGLRRHTSTAAG